jgi:hypothetical protein
MTFERDGQTACLRAAVLAGALVMGLGSYFAEAALPEPPPMPRRVIKPSASPPPGQSLQLTNDAAWATLFLPEGWRVPSDGRTTLVVHFHTVPWFTIQEHVRRESKLPLLNFALGEGSATYARPFLDPVKFQTWLRIVEAELVSHGGATNTRVTGVDISSFSAGYGAVREILKLETNRSVVRRVVLCDSLYGGLAETNAPYPQRKVLAEHVEPWRLFAQAAARGEKTFLLTTSDIETARYASTRECGSAVAAVAGAEFKPVVKDSCVAARETEYPLVRRADLGRFHVWNYAGTNAQAHLTHVRHLADLWRALDAANGSTDAE